MHLNAIASILELLESVKLHLTWLSPTILELNKLTFLIINFGSGLP